MLRLRGCILSNFLSSPSTFPGLPLQRLLSAAAPRIAPNPSFAVEDYLVGTCGLTPAQALKASTKLSHLKSPTNPDAVLAYLAGLGLSSADVAAAVAKDPLLLCVNVEKTLDPVVVGLTGHGLSHTEIARLVSLGRSIFRCSLEKVVKPNVAFLRKCGLGDCVISKLCLSTPWLLSANLERVQAIVACAEGLGVPRGSAMFRHALHAVVFLSEEKIATQVENLKNMFRWSDAEVGIAISKLPMILTISKEVLQSKSKFLISEVGFEPAYIARRPAMLCYSLEGRIRPRYHVFKFLKEKGLLHQDRDFYSALMIGEKVFLEKFICPYEEAAPHLAEDYAASLQMGIAN